LGYKGLLTEDGIVKFPISNWSEGENPFKDISIGLAKFIENGIVGRKALVVSPIFLFNCKEYSRAREQLNMTE